MITISALYRDIFLSLHTRAMSDLYRFFTIDSAFISNYQSYLVFFFLYYYERRKLLVGRLINQVCQFDQKRVELLNLERLFRFFGLSFTHHKGEHLLHLAVAVSLQAISTSCPHRSCSRTEYRHFPHFSRHCRWQGWPQFG